MTVRELIYHLQQLPDEDMLVGRYVDGSQHGPPALFLLDAVMPKRDMVVLGTTTQGHPIKADVDYIALGFGEKYGEY
jgi:hypothetical protein